MTRLFITSLLLIISCGSGNTNQAARSVADRPSKHTAIPSASDLPNRYFTGAQYLSISKVELLAANELSFQISWDASWRMGDAYDAAWIFIKSKNHRFVMMND